ncbi:MAG: hypothetical protein HY894_02365 [Deltaproteobacteria bacterium]|nr:hypothetical protein [Deltaproteobacteria bacterium]
MKVSELTVDELEAIIHRAVEDEMEDLYLAIDLHARGMIEEGMRDLREGRTISLDEVMARRKARGGGI